MQLSPERRADLTECISVWHPRDASGAWDVNQLYDPRLQMGLTAGITGAVSGTVTVAGKVYYADDANYFFFGAMYRAMSLCGGRGNDALDESYLAEAERKVFAWRLKSGLTNVTARMQFVRAGFYGDFSYLVGVDLPKANPSEMPYPGVLQGHWGRVLTPDEINSDTGPTQLYPKGR